MTICDSKLGIHMCQTTVSDIELSCQFTNAVHVKLRTHHRLNSL